MTLEEIKEQYAQEKGFDNWVDLYNRTPPYDFDRIFSEVSKRYASAKLAEAGEKALDAVEENESNLKSVSLNAIAEGLANIKESITSIPLD